MVTIEDVKKEVEVLSADEQQILRDCVRHGCWGDAEYEFLKSRTSVGNGNSEILPMMGYCTNDAVKGGHFKGRVISALFRGIYRKMCQDGGKVGYVMSHCNNWWGDGSGDMLFIRYEWADAFEEWARE